MKKIALLLLILVQACTAIINGPNTPIWDTGLFISVLDEEGNDLLNPDARYPKSINTNTIRLYHIIDGKESLVYNNSGESRWGYALLEPEGKYTNYRVRIAVNISS
ncbi:MAG: hypothetical protein LBL90_11335, partial [Prevotellaceae bacterium]|nr:hypothetical protein [Prevotellaceae bacterium]